MGLANLYQHWCNWDGVQILILIAPPHSPALMRVSQMGAEQSDREPTRTGNSVTEVERHSSSSTPPPALMRVECLSW